VPSAGSRSARRWTLRVLAEQGSCRLARRRYEPFKRLDITAPGKEVSYKERLELRRL